MVNALQIGTHLSPEDIGELQAQSARILEDPICDVEVAKVPNFIVAREGPAWDQRSVVDKAVWLVTERFSEKRDTVNRLTDLVLDRLQDEELRLLFRLDQGFNHTMYFMTIHAWLLHRRLILEGKEGYRIDDDLFESCWACTKQWMQVKKVKEFRFSAELRNTQEYMFTLMLSLDDTLDRADILAARMQLVLWANVYSGEPSRNAHFIVLLTKYILRQLSMILQLPAESVMEGRFKWADFQVTAVSKEKLEKRKALMKVYPYKLPVRRGDAVE